jgi:cyclopropane fatty-acyl-phospholipid synthase-like methyltransferase
MNTPYDEKFYDDTSRERMESARVVVPIIMHLYGPQSMLDVGCAYGEWLYLARMINTEMRCLAIDGSHVQHREMVEGIFLEADLEKGIPYLPRKYDVGMCLEVAEHLTPTAGHQLVKWLCSHAKTIIWSAAIPLQGGVHHINEQWPEYWRQEFMKYEFHPTTEIRELIWQNPLVQPYYRQNIITYTKGKGGDNTLDVVHPEMWEYKIRALKG